MRRLLVLVTAFLTAVVILAPVAEAGDSPSGYWWGSDSSGPAPSSSASPCASSSAPYYEPNVSRSGCGDYGGYFGEEGGYWSVLGCSASNAYNGTAASDGATNAGDGDGLGTSMYFFGGGPGMDPNYNATTSEASAWGKKEAEKAVSLAGTHANFDTDIIWLDVEDDYPSTPPSGWNEVVVPGTCGSVKSSGISASVDKATITGFLNYIFDDTSYWEGVYSSPGEWSNILGSGSVTTLSDTMEWTATYGENCVQPGPAGWTQGAGSCSSHSAGWFGGVTSSSTCAVAWQWAGVSSGDYDQINVPNAYDCQ
jgi:hypothetical protein